MSWSCHLDGAEHLLLRDTEIIWNTDILDFSYVFVTFFEKK